MSVGIEVRVVHVDEHLIELRVWASNGTFTGQVDIYANSAVPAETADKLRGFPSSKDDTREIELGTFRTDAAGGGAALRFCCNDSAGHVTVVVWLQGDVSRSGAGVENATFSVPIEAAAVDRFVQQLERMSSTVGNGARLEGLHNQLL
jgi:hypothetical protein